MAVTSYKLPSSEGLVVGSNIESGSEISKYKGGALLGWNILAKVKAKIIFYDNASEASGTNFGPLFFAAEENKTIHFGYTGIKFSNAIWMKVVEGEVEGVIWLDIE